MDNDSNHKFIEAKKLITSQEVLEGKFLKSQTFTQIMDFICFLQKSVEGKSVSDTPLPKNPNLLNFIDLLNYLTNLITEIPPLEGPQRFGNKAYKTWYDRVESEYDSLIAKIIDTNKHKDLDSELKHYFLECFGSSKRIDYGTGHELNFICILYILFATGYYTTEEFEEVTHHIFFNYLLLVRNLQKTYKLEPAGAHGVWGLDEYHFLPFLFGASELINNPEILPKSIHDDNLIKMYSDKYMYLSCVEYIKTVKKGVDFAEHSPMLDTVSNVPNWEKVAKGLVKMYIDHVMKKYVIMQHFYFGSIIKLD